VRLAVASSSPVAIPYVEELLDSHHEIAYLFSNPDKETGRGKVLSENAFVSWAAAQNLKVHQPRQAGELLDVLQNHPVDLVLTVAYGVLINSQALSFPKFGWLNAHYSLLPRWRGAAPVQYALMHGDSTTGLSIFRLEEGMDTGPIFMSQELSISPDDDTNSLLEKLSRIGASSIVELLDRIEAGATPIAQTDIDVTYAPKITKNEGHLDFTFEAKILALRHRALRDNPGNFVLFRNERLRINKMEETANVVNSFESDIPGEVKMVDGEFLIKARDGIFRILECTPAGKKRMSGADFARGARLLSGEVVG
jgi:methionyl-tRNA formyltransferase